MTDETNPFVGYISVVKEELEPHAPSALGARDLVLDAIETMVGEMIVPWMEEVSSMPEVDEPLVYEDIFEDDFEGFSRVGLAEQTLGEQRFPRLRNPSDQYLIDSLEEIGTTIADPERRAAFYLCWRARQAEWTITCALLPFLRKWRPPAERAQKEVARLEALIPLPLPDVIKPKLAKTIAHMSPERALELAEELDDEILVEFLELWATP